MSSTPPPKKKKKKIFRTTGSNIYATLPTPNIFIHSIAMPSRLRKLSVCDDIADVAPALGQVDQSSELNLNHKLEEFMILGLTFSCILQPFPQQPAQVLELYINKTGPISVSVGQIILNHCRPFMILLAHGSLVCLTNKDNRRVNYTFTYITCSN